MAIRLGTSGWSYKEWVDVFYPSKETPKLKHYSKLFLTVEIDSTFYAYPGRSTVAGWVRHTPEGFVFSAKLPKMITHDKILDLTKGVEVDLRRFLDLMEPVRRAGKLGVLLVQLPPFFRRGLRRLEEFFKTLPDGYRWAVEFRHPSWLRQETWDLLRRYRVANTIVDEPLLPPDLPATAEHTIIRWHGHGEAPWYNYHYREEELQPWVERVQKISAESPEIYGYFNNHFRAYAVENCIQMMSMLGLAGEEHRKVGMQIKKHLSGESGQTTLGEFL